jgi:DNA polymerase III epsilon subunit-like protein
MKAIYFDIETGGLLEDDPIIQLAAVAVDESAWTTMEEFECKIRFNEDSADPKALEICHYDPRVWEAQAVDAGEAITKFSAFLNRHKSLQMISKRTGNPYMVARLVGHNAATFDGPRLKSMYQRLGAFLPADPRVRCTVQQAMFWFDCRGIAPENYQLSTLCRYFGIPVDESTHDALVDVRLTVQLAKALRQQIQAVAA